MHGHGKVEIIQAWDKHCWGLKVVHQLDVVSAGRYREFYRGIKENISRGPTFGDFVTIRTWVSMQDVTVARLQEYRPPSPHFF
jgi:hypothetical protein